MPTSSIIQTPQELSPVNAPLWVVANSTDNTFPFFKYIFNIHSYDRFSTASTFLGQYKLPPRPDNNLGIFDTHKILQSQVGSYTFSYNQSGLQGVVDNNCVVKYGISNGYEYDPNYMFDNTFRYHRMITLGNLVGTHTFNNSTDNINVYPNTLTQGWTVSSSAAIADFIYTASFVSPYNPLILQVLDGTNDSSYFTVVGQNPTTPPYILTFIPDNDQQGTTLPFSSDIFKNNSATIPSTYTINLYDNIIYSYYLGLYFNNYPPNILIPGDVINVYMTNQGQNPSYNGKTVVVGTNLSTNPSAPVLSPATASLTLTQYGDIPNGFETGVVNLISRYTSISSTPSYAFPGTRQYTENKVDFGLTKAISSSASNWANNYVGNKQIFLNQYETLSVMALSASQVSNLYYQVKTYDVNFNLLNTYTSTNPTGITPSYIKYELGSGTKNLQGWNINGTPINLGSASYYSIGLTNSSIGINAVFTYSIVPNNSRYQNVRIMFQNRVGGYDYWNFNYDSKWTIDINRTLYTKQLDYNYNIGDRGRTILNIDANEMWEANTDWINEYDYNYLQELITSSDVYVIDEINGYKLPINIEDTSYVQKTAFRDRQFNLKITYRYAYDLNLQGS